MDWQGWVAAMSYNETSTKQILKTLFDWSDQTLSRVPLTDWYYTDDGLQTSGDFRARAVVGGLFSPLLLQKMENFFASDQSNYLHENSVLSPWFLKKK